MVETLTDIGAMVAIKETRGVSGEDLVVSDKAWELSRCLYDLRNNTENNVDAAVSTGVIIQEFDKVGVSSWGELDARRNMGGLDNKDQEDLWVDMVDAVCICTFMKYGDDKDFIKAVKKARKRDEYSPSELEKDFFGGLGELDGVGELITEIFPTNSELRRHLRVLSSLAKRGDLSEKIISNAMDGIYDIEGANEEHKAMILAYLQELGEGIRIVQDEGDKGREEGLYEFTEGLKEFASVLVEMSNGLTKESEVVEDPREGVRNFYKQTGGAINREGW